MSDLISSNDMKNLSLQDSIIIPEEELKEWQMLLMTSADPLKKQEAFRRVYLSQLDVDKKRKYCFQILSDSSSELKKDAFKALAHLGGDPRLLNCLENMLDNSSIVRQQAVKQLPQLLKKNGNNHWVLSFIVKDLIGSEINESVLEEFYIMLQKMNASITVSLLPEVIKVLLSAPETLERKARLALSGWATNEERGMALLDEAELHVAGTVGEWLLPLVFESGIRGEKIRNAMVTQLISHEGVMDPTGIGNLIVQLGAESLDLLMEKFNDSKRPVYVLFVMSQIVIRESVEGELLERVFEFCLQLLIEGSRDLLSTLLGFPFARLEFSDDKKEKWIKELLYCREGMSSIQLLNEIDYQIISAGELSSPVLNEMFLNSDDTAQKIHALQLLVKLLPDKTDKLVEMAEVLDEKIKENSFDRGELLKAFGYLWKRKSYPTERRDAEVESFLLSLWKKSRTVERFEAMSMALPLLETPMANRVIFSLLDLLESKLPEIEKKSLTRKMNLIDGAHLEHQLLMVGLNGMLSSVKRKDVLPELFDQIKELLYNLWKKEVSDRQTLGPGAMPALVRIFVIFIQKHVDERETVLELICDNLERPSVLKVLPELWMFLEDKHVDKVGHFILNEFKEIRQLEYDEVNTLLGVARVLIENADENRKNLASTVLTRLNSLKRHNLKQVNKFLEEGLIVPDAQE